MDDTYYIVMGNIDTKHFFHMTVKILLETVDKIMEMAKKEETLYEKDVVKNRLSF